MSHPLEQLVCQATGARVARRGEVLQSLWSGYGEIVRFHLEGAEIDRVILKHVIFPSEVDHPRGWHNDRSHQRKLHSYEVEMAWYGKWAGQCDAACRLPRCYQVQSQAGDHLMVLEDLDAAGFPRRESELGFDQARVCLDWLAHFHARFMGAEPQGLWTQGSYWHLATRPDEWAAIEEPAIRDAAAALDRALEETPFKTLIHGDAKVANFCFSADGRAVAAVDFQYVGGGCGMKDVAYFLGSCLSERKQRQWEAPLLDGYFNTLRDALAQQGKGGQADAVEAGWRELFPVAQADFYRFLVGWMPEHWKIHDYSRQVAMGVVGRYC